MRRVFQWINSVVGTAQTWFAIVGSIPSIVTGFMAAADGLPPYLVIYYCSFVLAGSMCAAYYSWVLWEKAAGYLTSSREKKRIATQLDEYVDAGYSQIDTPTAAAIWANTKVGDDLNRHLRFRIIKAAINKGDIKNAKFRAGTGKKANQFTQIPIDELKAYFANKGVI